MQTIFVDKQISKILVTKMLQPLWPDIVFSAISPATFGNLEPGELPGGRWVRVQNEQCGICGTDLTLLYTEVDLTISAAVLPATNRIYLGHEVVGHVTEVGAAVSSLKVGDRVVMDTRFQGATCLSQEITPVCKQCEMGNYMLCENACLSSNRRGVGGGWGDGFVAHETEVYRVPTSLTDDEAMMVEPLSTGIRAALRKLPLAGQTALIVGAGTVGLNVVQCVRALSPNCHIAIIGRHAQQKQMALKLGANEIVAGMDSHEALARITSAKLYKGFLGNITLLGGFDVVFDCVGTASSLSSSLRWARAGGTVVMVGITMRPHTLDLTPVWHQEVKLLGVCAHGAENWEGSSQHPYAMVINLLRDRKLTVEGFITHRFALHQWKEAVKTARNKRTGAIKVVLNCRSEGGH